MSDLSLTVLAAQKGDSANELLQRFVSRPCWDAEFPILASAARTGPAAVASSAFSSPRGAASLLFNFKATVAGTGSLGLRFVSGISTARANTTYLSAALISGATSVNVLVYPGISTPTGGIIQLIPLVLPPAWYVSIEPTDGSTWTYQVDGRYMFR